MTRERFGKYWSVAVGGVDAVTGLLLVYNPLLVLRLLGLPVPDDLVLFSWIGIFVAGVGLSYGFALQGGRELLTVWRVTALTRGLVAVFVFWKVSTGALAAGWVLVAVSDAVVAIVQVIALGLGCGRGVGK